jgi:hypothetical protein
MRPPIVRATSTLLCMVLVSANAQGDPQSVPADWLKLDAGPFSILAPSGWEFHQLDGADSYVGEFVRNSIVLRFDYGRYSNPLKEERKPIYVVIHKTIDGHAAKIASPRVPGHGITGIYFRNAGNASALTLFGKDLTPAQQELALKIFDTLRFGGPPPRYVVPPPPPPRTSSDGLIEYGTCTPYRTSARSSGARPQNGRLRYLNPEKKITYTTPS